MFVVFCTLVLRGQVSHQRPRRSCCSVRQRIQRVPKMEYLEFLLELLLLISFYKLENQLLKCQSTFSSASPLWKNLAWP